MDPIAADPADLNWLVSSEADEILATATGLSGELTTRLTRLRTLTTPARARLVLQQVELRQRAGEKFSAAARMFFTQQGLEQATDEFIAAYKAQRFAGKKSVFDLCCGIGGDLAALGGVASVSGFDRDPLSVAFSQANARACGSTNTTVRVADVVGLDMSACDAWHIDPDRRPQGRRTTRVELHEPSAAAIDRLLEQNPNGAVKMAPAATWPEDWNGKAEWEWISRGRQCRQLVAWFGSLAREHGRRRATVLNSASGTSYSFVGEPSDDVPVAGAIARYVFEPDPAILAAKLNRAFASRYELPAVATGIAYWTGPQIIRDPLLSCFEVIDIVPLDLKKLKALLRELDTGPIEIKVRGVEHDPVELRRKLATAGAKPHTLLLTRICGHPRAIVAKRVTGS